MTEDAALLAAIPFAQDNAVDFMLQTVARILIDEGYHVAGFLQFAADKGEGCCGAVDVENIETGERHEIMQALGQHARGCRLDPQVMTVVAADALKALETRPDIIILNRFGKGESEGIGLRSVFEAAALSRTPLLTSVKETFLPSWLEFADAMSATLPQDEEKVLDWCRQAITDSRRQKDAA